MPHGLRTRRISQEDGEGIPGPAFLGVQPEAWAAGAGSWVACRWARVLYLHHHVLSLGIPRGQRALQMRKCRFIEVSSLQEVTTLYGGVWDCLDVSEPVLSQGTRECHLFKGPDGPVGLFQGLEKPH